MDRSSKQKINKEIQVLNDTLDERDLIDIFRKFHPNTEEYTFFPSAHRTFSRIDHILGHKSNLSKFKKIEIISSIFSNTTVQKHQFFSAQHSSQSNLVLKSPTVIVLLVNFSSRLLVFVLCIEVLLCRVHRYSQLVCLPLGLIP